MKNSFASVMALLLAAGVWGYADGMIQGGNVRYDGRVVKYLPADLGADYRVWNKVIARTNTQGNISYSTNQAYVELATGLNYQDAQGQWQESKEEFQLVPGWAVANTGRHKIGLAYNLNTRGSVAVTMPDGHNMWGQVLALSYLDPATGQSVLLGEVKDCIGTLVASNQVLYADAFTDVKADVRYTYTKAGVEQDIVLREQLPDPSLIGLNPNTTRLAVVTEFINPPSASVTEDALSLDSTDTNSLPNEQIDLGVMRFGEGRAFETDGQGTASALGSNAPRVIKRWAILNGRTFLFEEVPLRNIRTAMSKLPKQASIHSLKARLLAQMEIPEQRLEKPGKQRIQIAAASVPEPSVIVDYVILSTGQSNYTFKGDSTYYISGTVNLSGTTTIEGGAVIKYAASTVAKLSLSGVLSCKTTEYHPAILTSKNDDKVGETISGSTGAPTNSNGGTYIYISGWQTSSTYKHLRFYYAGKGISAPPYGSGGVWHSQFVQCGTAIDYTDDGGLKLHNVLFSNCGTNIATQGNGVDGEHLTVDGGTFVNSASTTGGITNSIFAAVTNFGSLSLLNCAQYSTSSGLFQTVGGGNYYLSAASTNRDWGTTNISPTLLADFQFMTTHPPQLLSNTNLSAPTILSNQVPRDVDVPDLGYHYGVLDFLLSDVDLTSQLSLTSGVAVGLAGTSYALNCGTGASVASIGTPKSLNHISPAAAIQEKATVNPTFIAWTADTNSTFTFEFNELALGLGGVMPVIGLPEDDFTEAFKQVVIQNSLLQSASAYILDDDGYVSQGPFGLTNNVLERCAMYFTFTHFSYGSQPYPTLQVRISNNLFKNSLLSLGQDYNLDPDGYDDGYRVYWFVENNLFDGTAPYLGYTDYDAFTASHNGFTAGTANNLGGISNKNNLVADYQTGALGGYYYPTSGTNLASLINAGSTNANLLGLYHYTTTTNQVKETNSVVDIGFHYVAVDANGNPLDTDDDSVPDYVEDENGNGVRDGSETAWSKPTVAWLAPTNGSTFGYVTEVSLSASASDLLGITNVSFYYDGIFIGATTNGSVDTYSYNWTNPPAGMFQMTAVAINSSGASAVSTQNVAINISKTALFVVANNGAMTSADQAVSNELSRLGFLVSSASGAGVFPGDATNRTIVVVSSTIYSGDVNTKFRDVTAPVLTWEDGLYDDMNLTGTSATTDHNTLGSQISARIENPSHPMAAGLSGSVIVVSNSTSFSWGQPGTNATLVATTADDPSKSLIFGYDKGAIMLNGQAAPARRVGFFFDDNVPSGLRLEGWSLFDAAILWAAGVTNLPAPVVTWLTPTNDSFFQAGTNLTLTVYATNEVGIRKVVYFQNGVRIGEQTAGTNNQYSLTWSNAPAGSFLMTAKAISMAGTEATTTQMVAIGIQPAVLLVVPDASSMTTGDTAISNRLALRGYIVRVKNATAVSANDAAGNTIVLVSSTITSSTVNRKFRDTTTPVITWEHALFDDMNLTLDGASEHGTISNQTQVIITNSLHPLAASLTGTVSVVSNASILTWGAPLSNAVVIAHSATDPSKVVLYGYEKWALMENGEAAPGRRVGFFLEDATATSLTTNGWALFDAAVDWAAEPPQCYPAVDVMLVLDTSGSMGDESKLASAKVAAANFLDGLAAASDQVGLVSFTNASRLVSPLTNDFSYVKTGLNGLVADGETRIDVAITNAADALTGARHNPAALPIMILLSDGANSVSGMSTATLDGYTTNAATAAKAAGIRIVTIALGSGANTNLLRTVASSPDDYLLASDASQLQSIYDLIATSICRGSGVTNPSVSWTSPTNGQVFAIYTSEISLTATALPGSGTLTGVGFYDGPTPLGAGTDDGGGTYSFLWTNAAAGVVTLTAIATNSYALTTSATITFTNSVGLSVMITSPTNGQFFSFTPTNILITAAITNPAGTITTVPVHVGTNLLGDASATTNGSYELLWTNATWGVYTVTVSATNSEGGYASDSVVITNNALPSVSIISPTNIESFTEVTNVTLRAVATDAEDGTNVTVKFYYTNSAIGEAAYIGGGTNSLVWSNRLASYYPVVAVATDSAGASSSSAIVVFKVNSTNTPPTVNITSPTNGSVFAAGSDLTITATASDSDGSVTNLEFFVNDVFVGSDSEAPYTLSECCMEPGTYILKAKATDNLGGVGYSTNTTVVIANATPKNGNGVWDPQFSSINVLRYVEGVRAVAVDQAGHVYAGSSDTFGNGGSDVTFTNNNSCVAMWDGQTWEGIDVSHATSRALKVINDVLYGAGMKYNNDEQTNSGYFAQWNGNTNWTDFGDELYMPSSQDPLVSQLGIVAFTVVGSDFYVGGDFTSSEYNSSVQYVAKLAGTNWAPVGNGLTMPTNGAIRAMTSIGNTLYIGGDFTAAGGNTNIHNLARLEGNTWTNVGAGVNGVVRALAVCNSNLYVGGDFTAVGGLTVNCVAKWDGASWSGLGSGVFGGEDTNCYVGYSWSIPSVHALTVRGNEVFVAGEFRSVYNGGIPLAAYHVAKATWSESGQKWVWSALDNGVSMPPGDGIPDIALSSTIYQLGGTNSYDFFLGGYFYNAGLTESHMIARWHIGGSLSTNAPSVAITSPTNFASFDESDNIHITADATASGTNEIDSVEFFVDSTPWGGALNSPGPYETDYYAAAGLYKLTASATDFSSPKHTGNSAPVYIIVTNTSGTVIATSDAYNLVMNGSATNLDVLQNDYSTTNLPLRIIEITPDTLNVGSVEISHDQHSLVYKANLNAYGVDVFAYAVTDGVSTNAAYVKVHVRATPIVYVYPPAEDDGFLTNSPVAVGASTFDYEGTVTNVSLALMGDQFAATNFNGLTTNWTTNVAGFYTFTATAMDDNGLVVTSDPVTIVVSNATASPNLPIAVISNLVAASTALAGVPAADYPAIQDGFFELEGNASDPDNDPVTYQVLLFRPEDEDGSGSDDSEALVKNTAIYANLTPGTLNFQGFHVGASIGALGRLDFSAVPNGIYDLVLRVRGGSDETNAIVRIRLDSQLKIGQFSFSEQDMAIPVNGIPLTVTRTYDSMNPRSSDFGFGWTYALNSMDVQLDETREDFLVGGNDNTVPWADEDEEANGLPKTVSIRTGGGWDVTLTLPDGRRTTFAFGYDGIWPELHAKWQAPADVHARLEMLGNNDIVFGYAGWDVPTWADSDLTSGIAPLENQDIKGWVLTTADGTQYYITRGDPNYVVYQKEPGQFPSARVYGQPKLTRIVQRSGDEIRITDSGIQHYAGGTNLTRSVLFDRDSAGRITAIRDPNAGTNGLATVKYVYNHDTGNLIQVQRLQDRAEGTYFTNKYHYDNPNFPHYITSIEDPRGIPVARNEYDEQGRLKRVTDADGQVTEFSHNPTNDLEVVIDRMGYTNSYVYDPRGNVTVFTNTLGLVTMMAYDSLNQKTAETNAAGTAQETWTHYAYDANGNQTNVISFGSPNHTNSFAYDQYGNLTNQVDALGNITVNLYDDLGNLTNTLQYNTNGVLVTQSSSVYENGLLTETRDANGNLTASFGYDDSGNLTNTTDARGVARSLSYDANGNQTNTSYVSTNYAGSPVTVTTATIYDAAGRVTMSIDALGLTNRTVYNASGKPDYTIDRLGNTNSFLYDARGNLIQSTFPNGITRTVYDANARPVYATDRNGITGTRTEYDALGRATNVVRLTNVWINITGSGDSLNSELGGAGTPISTNSTEYYPSGWVKSRTGPDGHTTTYGYWPDGQLMTVTNALTNVTHYAYDLAGRQKLVVDALTHTNQFEYDALGRQIKTIFADNTYVTNLYNNLGQRTGVQDQAQLLTQFAYDASGALTNVTKPQVPDPDNPGQLLTPSWGYEYDAYGRLTVTTDPNHHATTNRYDQFGRQVARFLAAGSGMASNVYNNLGQLAKQYDFKGQRTEFLYDQYGRTKAKFLFPASSDTPEEAVCYRYNELGQLTNLTERYGVDADTNACDGYLAFYPRVGQRFQPYSLPERVLAWLRKVPAEMLGALAVIPLLALMLWSIPGEARHRFAWEMCVAMEACGILLRKRRGAEAKAFNHGWARMNKDGDFLSVSTGERSKHEVLNPQMFCREAWRLGVSAVKAVREAAGFGLPAATNRRLRLPSLFWRISTCAALGVLILNDPSFDRLWTANASCDIPGNDSTATTRITNFTYDLEGRLTQVNAPEGVINYGYDLATGRHVSTCTTNSEVAYGYDALGRLQTVHVIRRNNAPVDETTTYHYDSVGNRSEVDLPNGVVTTYLYDSLNRLTNLVHQAGTTNLATYRYLVDATGRRTNADEILRQEDQSYQTNTFVWQYDGMHRLTNEISLSATASSSFSYTNAYVYDGAGNRLHKIRTGGGAETIDYSYNANDELTNEVSDVHGTTTYCYDANGSLTNKTTGGGTLVYLYNTANKLNGVTTSGSGVTNYFQYNDAGIRVQSWSSSGGNPTIYLIDSNNHTGYAQVLEELSTPNTQPIRSYVIGDDVLAQATSTASYLLYDGHGSTRQLAGDDGNIAERYNYDAYGTVDTATSTTSAENAATSLLYSGEQYEGALGMYNLRARYYNPANGRFNQRDAFKGNNFDPQSLHKYTYANCDPVNGIDPSGNFTLVELMVVVAIVAIVGGLISGTISKVTGGSFAEGFAKGMMSSGLTTLFAVFGVPLPLAMALGSSLSQLVIEWYVNGFGDPTMSAIRITVAFIMGLIGGAILNKLPPLAANTEQLSKIFSALELDHSVKVLSEEIGKMALKGFSMGVMNRMIGVFSALAESVYKAGQKLIGGERDKILKQIKDVYNEPDLVTEPVGEV